MGFANPKRWRVDWTRPHRSHHLLENDEEPYLRGKTFHRAEGFKSNYICAETGESFWISGPKKRGGDALHGTNIATEIDDDVRVEYWTEIRKQPERLKEAKTL